MIKVGIKIKTLKPEWLRKDCTLLRRHKESKFEIKVHGAPVWVRPGTLAPETFNSGPTISPCSVQTWPRKRLPSANDHPSPFDSDTAS